MTFQSSPQFRSVFLQDLLRDYNLTYLRLENFARSTNSSRAAKNFTYPYWIHTPTHTRTPLSKHKDFIESFVRVWNENSGTTIYV